MEEFLIEKKWFSEKSKSVLQSSFVFSGAFVVLALFALLLANIGNAAGLSQASELERQALDPLTTNLYAVEKKASELLQEQKESGYLYYILSMIAARQFSEDPSAMPLLRQATELAQQAIDLAPNQDFGYVALAGLLDTVGQTDKAFEVLEIAQKSVKTLSWRYKYQKAKISLERAATSDVLADMRSALIEKDSIKEIIVPSIISIAAASFKDFELIEVLESINTASRSAYFELSIAQEYARLGLHKKSADLLVRIEKDYPNVVEAKINRAVLTYRYMGQSGKSEAIFK